MNQVINKSRLHSLKFILISIAICSVLLCVTDVQSSENKAGHAWEPPAPFLDKHDWIQLTSNEWLKGSLEGLYNDRLEFDSDKLGFREFKWKDVRQVLSNNLFYILFADQTVLSGYLQVVEEKVFITTGEQKKEFNRDQIIAVTPGYSKTTDLWKAKIGIGFNISKGNTDQIQYNVKANLRYRTLKTGFELDYLGNYISTDNEKTSDSQRLSGYFDMLNAGNYFFRVVHAEYYRDPFQNIKYRVTAGSAAGLALIDNKKTDWDVKAGPAYQVTGFESVEEGKDQSASTFALDAGTHFDTELTGRLDFIADYDFKIVSKKSGRYMHHGIVTLETELTDLLEFDISFIWDRTQEPAQRSDGTIPEKDDFQLRFSVSIDF